MKFHFNKKEWEGSMLKPGGYIGKIKNVIVAGEKISVAFDIAEGEFKDMFLKEYQKAGGTAKFDLSKWNKKAVVNFDFKYTGAKYAFAQLLNDIEVSNQTFRWNDETDDLKNKLVGVVYKKNTYTDKFGDVKQGTDFPTLTSTKVIATNQFSIDEDNQKQETSSSDMKTVNPLTDFDVQEDDIEF